jgi:hypothetical protein
MAGSEFRIGKRGESNSRSSSSSKEAETAHRRRGGAIPQRIRTIPMRRRSLSARIAVISPAVTRASATKRHCVPPGAANTPICMSSQ